MDILQTPLDLMKLLLLEMGVFACILRNLCLLKKVVNTLNYCGQNKARQEKSLHCPLLCSPKFSR